MSVSSSFLYPWEGKMSHPLTLKSLRLFELVGRSKVGRVDVFTIIIIIIKRVQRPDSYNLLKKFRHKEVSIIMSFVSVNINVISKLTF